MSETKLEDVHMGMRVQAVWQPRETWTTSMKNIKYFKPSGEPDATVRELQGPPLMRDVAVISFSQAKSVRREADRNEVEILMPVVHEARDRAGLGKKVDFICSGSSDYLAGQSFAFVSGLDSVGAWPPIAESHVEADGAWALYEAWVKIQMGYADTALVYGFGKPSMGDLPEVLALQLDPYTATPLWPDAVSIAALQARLCLDAGVVTERQMAEVAVRDRRNAKSNRVRAARRRLRGREDPGRALPRVAAPAPRLLADLGRRVRDGDRVRRRREARLQEARPGSRASRTSPSRRISACATSRARARRRSRPRGPASGRARSTSPRSTGRSRTRSSWSSARSGSVKDVKVNPSGGALAANPIMAAGLTRIGEAARAISEGGARARSLTRPRARACNRTSSACWRVEGWPSSAA